MLDRFGEGYPATPPAMMQMDQRPAGAEARIRLMLQMKNNPGMPNYVPQEYRQQPTPAMPMILPQRQPEPPMRSVLMRDPGFG